MSHEHCNIAMFAKSDLISLNALVEAVTKQWVMPKGLKTIRILFDSLFLERQA
jgi:ABC-type microcin C transport system permease subunit YejB